MRAGGGSTVVLLGLCVPFRPGRSPPATQRQFPAGGRSNTPWRNALRKASGPDAVGTFPRATSRSLCIRRQDAKCEYGEAVRAGPAGPEPTEYGDRPATYSCRAIISESARIAQIGVFAVTVRVRDVLKVDSEN